MIKNFITIAYRNFLRNKFFSFINLLGLSFGIACCILILNFVSHEFSYESSHEKRDQIVRLLSVAEQGDQLQKLAVSANIIGPSLKREFPEIEEFSRFYNIGGFRALVVKHGDKILNETAFAMADQSFLEMFSFEFLSGDAEKALTDPMTCIMTESTARKYFGEEYPIGKEIRVSNSYDVTVTGVIADLPNNTVLDFNILMAFHSFKNNVNESWFPMNYITYLELSPNSNRPALTAKVNTYVEEKFQEAFGDDRMMDITYELQPLDEIYLSQGVRADFGKRSSRANNYSFAIIGIFILIIACINYINLTTAKSEKRAREVGIRKVMGALQKQLVYQFYGETLIITLIAGILAVGIAELSLPYFNELADQNLDLNIYSFGSIFGLLLGICLVSLVSGSYPAIFLSSFMPAVVLKGGFKSGKAGNQFRKVLVTGQFFIAASLIMGVLVVFQQMQYASEKKMGFNSEAVAVVSISGREARNNMELVKTKYLQQAEVSNVSLGSEVMGSVVAGYGCLGEGMDESLRLNCFGFTSDEDLFETLDLEIIAGEGYRRSTGDSTLQFLINESLLQEMGWSPEEALTTKFDVGFGQFGRIVGVVKDFHFNSLKSEIEPIALWLKPEDAQIMYVKMSAGNLSNTVRQLQREWEALNPNSPFELTFLDDELNSLYENERRTGNVLILFTVLSLIIGCLGLFGLTTFVVEKRTKEIGIRKVLGASEILLVRLLSWDFLKLVLIANLLAFPMAWYVMNQWLDNFAYHISIGWEIFLLTGTIGVAISMLTVIFHALRTARSNPAFALRNE